MSGFLYLFRARPVKRASVILEEYSPSWSSKFDDEKGHLMAIAGHWCYGGIEHVGSTAVPGMVAKPVIDIMFGVKSLEESRPFIDVLVDNGYEYWPYKADVMHWFCKPSDAFRTHHLHLVPFASPLWQERIIFRDILRSNERIASNYAQLKRELAALYKDEREIYTEKKWPFIQKVLQRP
ncbi:MAG TPA: GrpB family protein [Cellvibrionaceae bacterium]